MTKAIVPAAGLGTRLLPATKEQPKEMLPIIVRSSAGTLHLKPFLQLVFEQLYGSGFRELCFIVGRGKRSIEDHFTADDSFVDFLKSRNKTEYLNELSGFYEQVRNCTIAFANQPKPLGFADAVKRGRFFVGNENFLVHAGDDLVISKVSYIRRLVSTFEKYDADAAFFVQKVEDPRKYGVATGKEIKDGIYHLTRIVEKPARSVSKLAIVAIYAFSAKLFDAIENVKPGVNNELQLSDAIQELIRRTDAVYAVELNSREKRIEIGDPISYREAFTAKI